MCELVLSLYSIGLNLRFSDRNICITLDGPASPQPNHSHSPFTNSQLQLTRVIPLNEKVSNTRTQVLWQTLKLLRSHYRCLNPLICLVTQYGTCTLRGAAFRVRLVRGLSSIMDLTPPRCSGTGLPEREEPAGSGPESQ